MPLISNMQLIYTHNIVPILVTISYVFVSLYFYTWISFVVNELYCHIDSKLSFMNNRPVFHSYLHSDKYNRHII